MREYRTVCPNPPSALSLMMCSTRAESLPRARLHLLPSCTQLNTECRVVVAVPTPHTNTNGSKVSRGASLQTDLASLSPAF